MPGMYDELLGQSLPAPATQPAPQKQGFSFGGVLDKVGQGLLQLRRISPAYQQEQKDKAEIAKILAAQGDPLAARAAGVGVEHGINLWDKGVDNARQQAVADSQIRENQDQYDTLTHQRAGAMIGSATKDTYPALRQRYYDYYKTRGVQPYIELPDTFDEASVMMVQRANMTPDQQLRLDAQNEYRDELIDYRRATEAGRNERAEEAEEGRDRRARLAEDGRNDRDDPPRVSVLERIREKLAEGKRLTPGEQQLYDDSLPANKRRRPKGKWVVKDGVRTFVKE